MKLYDYYRSSAAYRLRIALNLKGLDYERIPVNLLEGEHQQDAYKKINPQGSVPTLVDGNVSIYQSLAAIEYLEEVYPASPLLPADPIGRARARSLALSVAYDIHPIINLRVQQYIQSELGASDAQKLAWYQHWIAVGFATIETLLQSPDTGIYCHGDTPTIADICLIPQIYGAKRFECDLSPYPTILRINEACLKQEAFSRASPGTEPA